MEMRGQTNLVKRKGSSLYQFEKKIPKDLQAHYSGRKSIRVSLGTSDKTTAKGAAAALAKQWEDEFASLRVLYPAAPTPARVQITSDLVPKLAVALEASILRADDEMRLEGMSDDEFGERVSSVDASLSELGAAYARGSATPIRAALEDWINGLGIEVDLSSSLGKQLARKFLEGRLRALAKQKQRNQGEPVETPEAPTPQQLGAELHARTKVSPERSPGDPKLADVVTYWKSTSPKALRTIAAADNLVRRFVTLHGDIPLSAIGKGHFVALRDSMLAEVTPSTVQSKFNLLRAAFTVCLQDDQMGITASPMEHVVIRKGPAAEHPFDAFSADELQTIFDSPVFMKGERPKAGKGETLYWAPLLSLFTGARLNEVLQLRVDDLYVREDVPVTLRSLPLGCPPVTPGHTWRS